MEKPLQKLRDECNFQVNLAIDLGIVEAEKFAKPDLRKAGLNELVMKLLSEQLPTQRKMRRSRWDRSELSEDQITHLCVEVFSCCRLMESLETMESMEKTIG
jgi:hypothetical protein